MQEISLLFLGQCCSIIYANLLWLQYAGCLPVLTFWHLRHSAFYIVFKKRATSFLLVFCLSPIMAPIMANNGLCGGVQIDRITERTEIQFKVKRLRVKALLQSMTVRTTQTRFRCTNRLRHELAQMFQR